jgi:hypothetical protein
MQLKNIKLIKDYEAKLKNVEQKLEIKLREVEELKFINNENTNSLFDYEKSLVKIENENNLLKTQNESLKTELEHQNEK